ncbi:MAG: FAD-binding oxidoreductase [Aestuariivirga sp.]|uniref:FAD-binding oxidoreductase n=1 Tax=Aestuariivirga sp. TaxID=2650926 RepID=UPI0038D06724
MKRIDELTAALGSIPCETNPRLVAQRSRDFYWYSPVLKRQLDGVTGDIVISPRSEAEVVDVLAACYRLDIPVTPRGGGTGNYGQAMPLSGGAVLDLRNMSRISGIEAGVVSADAGAIIHDIDRAAQAHSGQELRMHPSTARNATIGGFIAGGSGGVGSIRWGTLRDLGNVISARVVTMEASPRILALTGYDLHKVIHAYGTNGIITSLELPLTAAYDWIDTLVTHDSWLRLNQFADVLARQDGLLLKQLCTIEAPTPHRYFLKHQKYLAPGDHVIVAMVAHHAVSAFEALCRQERMKIAFRSDILPESEKRVLPPAYELAWNHTTLRAIRLDPSITYLQTLYPNPVHVEKIAAMSALFGEEVPGHAEYMRFEGRVSCDGMPLVRFSTEERLDEIVRIHEEHGCPVFNPHRYTLEEGGMKQTDEVQLAFKRMVDPKGLLNPGKMIAWDNPDYDFNAPGYYLFPGIKKDGSFRDEIPSLD